MILYVYPARWFSTLDWCWLNHDILAVSEEQARAYVDAHTEPAYRGYYGEKDSLKLGTPTEAKLPLTLRAGWSEP